MSSVLNILKPSISEREGNLYLYCQPITRVPPGDLPRVQKIAKKYWSAKITVEINGRTVDVTEWFSIPYRTLRMSLNNVLNGECFIMLEKFTEETQRSIFENTNPVFAIDESESDSKLRWQKD
jgi:hypothetical protein